MTRIFARIALAAWLATFTASAAWMMTLPVLDEVHVDFLQAIGVIGGGIVLAVWKTWPPKCKEDGS